MLQHLRVDQAGAQGGRHGGKGERQPGAAVTEVGCVGDEPAAHTRRRCVVAATAHGAAPWLP